MSRRPYVPTFGAAPEVGPQPKEVMPPEPPRCSIQSTGTSVAPSGAPPAPSLLRQRRPLNRRKRGTSGWYVVQAFGDALASERERRGWTISQAAQYCGMGDAQWRRMENAHVAALVSTANRVCRRLGITFTLGEWPE